MQLSGRMLPGLEEKRPQLHSLEGDGGETGGFLEKASREHQGHLSELVTGNILFMDLAVGYMNLFNCLESIEICICDLCIFLGE